MTFKRLLQNRSSCYHSLLLISDYLCFTFKDLSSEVAASGKRRNALFFFSFSDKPHAESKFIQMQAITPSLTMLGNPLYFTLPHLGMLRPICILISAIG